MPASVGRAVPGSAAARAAIAEGERLQRSLWGLAGEALAGSPTESAPRLYVESLNETIDMQTVQVSALNNRVPTAVLVIEVVGAAIALGLLALYLTILERSDHRFPGGRVRLGAAADHFRPRPTGPRTVQVPATPLVNLRASMELPPAARPPRGRRPR